MQGSCCRKKVLFESFLQDFWKSLLGQTVLFWETPKQAFCYENVKQPPSSAMIWLLNCFTEEFSCSIKSQRWLYGTSRVALHLGRDRYYIQRKHALGLRTVTGAYRSKHASFNQCVQLLMELGAEDQQQKELMARGL